MSIENELKIIPKEELNAQEILKVLEQAGYRIEGKPKIKKQEDIYYDDLNKTLAKKGCSFRIRKKENGAVVTYKSPINSDTQYKQREEIEEDIPEIYIQEDGSIIVEDAIDVLIKKYPNIDIPKDLKFAVKVINNRNKVNMKAQDGTNIEVALDNLKIQDENGTYYEMNNEMECEVINGNPGNLNDIYTILEGNYDIQRNELSKYQRAIKEMNEQKNNMSLEEIVICTMLSDIIKSKEFEQLKYKGQMIHDYRVPIPGNLSLDNFKDAEYLIRKISEVKRIKNYKPGRIKNLEEMFLCFFSDMDYRDIEYKLVNFLNQNYYGENTPITNRMLHSQQVMLITGLISKSKEISEKERKPLLCMASALVHDIGHVPGAHPTEEILETFDGFFSHEINGRNVIEKIISFNEQEIVDSVQEYGQGIGKKYNTEQIKEYIMLNKLLMQKSIEAHSRTNSEKRGEGTVVQLPREADKICYVVSDIVDIVKKLSKNDEEQVEFFTKDWKEDVSKKLGKGYEREEIIRSKIGKIEELIRTNNFGEIETNIANTVRENINDGKTYYDVEQDTWDIVNEMIKYVKNLRKTGVIDNRRKKIQYAATYFVIKTFNEMLEKVDGNFEDAWEQTLDKVTQSNDLDILNCINEIKEMYKNQPELLKVAFEKGGILDDSLIRQLDNSDRQIKIQPDGNFQMSDLQPYLGNRYNTPLADKFRDTYFDNQGEISICLREYQSRPKKEIIIKKKRDKAGVTQLERQRYSTEADKDTSLEELIERFNLEHEGLNIQLPIKIPKCTISTIRNKVENEDGIVIRKDKSTVVTKNGNISMPETIEIECANKDEIKKVKKKLNQFLNMYGISLESITTKETKEDQAIRLMKEEDKMR